MGQRHSNARAWSMKLNWAASPARGVLATAIAAGAMTWAGAGPAYADTSVPCNTAALVSAVNTVAGPDGPGGTLDLAAGCTYLLTSPAFTPTDPSQGADGLPQIFQNLTINGNGASIARSQGAPPFRIFEQVAGPESPFVVSGALRLNDLTVSNGLLEEPVIITGSGGVILGAGDSGGAIDDGSGDPLSISNSTFSGNKAVNGGAIVVKDPAFSVDHTTFVDNSAQFNGGAILDFEPCCSSSLSGFAAGAAITTSSFEGNAAGQWGGAISSDSSILSISQSTFVRNAAGSLNATGVGGGAIAGFDTANLAIINSTFTANTAVYAGGAIWGQTLNIPGATFTVTTSTIDGNTAGITGGGIALNNSVVTVDGSGITGNGIHVDTSIVARNRAPDHSDCHRVIDDGYNLDSGTSCAFSSANHSLSNTNPQLGPLANNGGPTETMALLPGSPAIDQIPPATTDPITGASVCQGTTDQRGITRPQGPACDIGAYELVP